MYFIIFGFVWLLGYFGGVACSLWWLTRMPHEGFTYVMRVILDKRIENVKDGKISDVK